MHRDEAEFTKGLVLKDYRCGPRQLDGVAVPEFHRLDVPRAEERGGGDAMAHYACFRIRLTYIRSTALMRVW
jgi:hypothetical protein